jgi:hypothetical protein
MTRPVLLDQEGSSGEPAAGPAFTDAIMEPLLGG